ncbi:hypothetical protein [Spiroplasma endosymbiont of Virgichneumon dumeticola]|uniref:hypothetical protein n=1 Tax=Spiroplasma endosymbiont of Virgichneumon dumeticola TaxID=3139323 RepID=UPI0035C89C05
MGLINQTPTFTTIEAGSTVNSTRVELTDFMVVQFKAGNIVLDAGSESKVGPTPKTP